MYKLATDTSGTVEIVSCRAAICLTHPRFDVTLPRQHYITKAPFVSIKYFLLRTSTVNFSSSSNRKY